MLRGTSTFILIQKESVDNYKTQCYNVTKGVVNVINNNIDDLECIKYKINEYLEKTDFKDNELVKISTSIQEYIEENIYNNMSEEDKKSHNLRYLLAHISNKLDYILTQI